MTFEEFLKLVRERIGYYCTDSYWEWKYKILPDKSLEYVETQMSSLAINAIGTDYASKNA
jgi:hypothetical protein